MGLMGWSALNSLRTYNSVVQRCFQDCISTFRSKNLDNTEERVSQLILVFSMMNTSPTLCDQMILHRAASHYCLVKMTDGSYWHTALSAFVSNV